MGVIIMGGEYRGRKLATDGSSQIIRPTSGKVREALFSSLGERLADAAFADLYAGSGSVGLEAFSRGAREVHLVENHPKSWALLKANIVSVLGATATREEASRVFPVRSDALAFCRKMRESGRRFDLVFADPPFAEDYTPLKDAVLGILVPGGTAIIQFPTRNPPAWVEAVVQLGSGKLKRYGESGLAFLNSEAEIPGHKGTQELEE
jgi:16S rRNA (guanine966-N2)-methyltransferase